MTWYCKVATQASALSREVAFIIKWNPRSAPIESTAARRVADAGMAWTQWREGTRECIWSEMLDLQGMGSAANQARRIYRLTERTNDRQGQPLLMAHYTLDGWTTTLPVAAFDESAVIALYADHATHEQFHSEFKTDMDLGRLPSGKFDTNYLVCALAAIAMNILRLMGQGALLGKDAPVRHAAKRRRIKTVMQELMYKAGRMIKHAGRWVLGIGANNSVCCV